MLNVKRGCCCTRSWPANFKLPAGCCGGSAKDPAPRASSRRQHRQSLECCIICAHISSSHAPSWSTVDRFCRWLSCLLQAGGVTSAAVWNCGHQVAVGVEEDVDPVGVVVEGNEATLWATQWMHQTDNRCPCPHKTHDSSAAVCAHMSDLPRARISDGACMEQLRSAGLMRPYAARAYMRRHQSLVSTVAGLVGRFRDTPQAALG